MSEMDEEFLPLPHFPYDERPCTTPLDIEEAATALYLNGGDTDAAAERLNVILFVCNVSSIAVRGYSGCTESLRL